MNTFRLLIISMAVCITTINALPLSDKESKGCSDEQSAEVNKKCNPYKNHLIYVSKDDIKKERNTHPESTEAVKNPPKPKLNKGLSLKHAVDKYIDRQENIQIKKEKKNPSQQSINSCLECEYIHLYLNQDKTSREFGSFRDIGPYIIMDQNRKYFFILRTRNIYSRNPETTITTKPENSKKIEKNRKKETIRVNQILHKVKRGETLSGIAYRYKSTVKDIRELNNMGDDAIIKIGDILRIPSQKKLVFDKNKFSQIRSMMGYYKVQKGESLGTLSRFFKVKISDIATLNGFDIKHKLKIGEKILLPLSQKNIDNLVDIRRIERELAERDRKRKARLKALRKYSKNLKYTNRNNFKHKIRVVATAYTSHKGQTDNTPYLAAWNNPIRPGMKIIAVSPDLIRRYGLTNGIKVKISGLPGIYTVRDKMNKRLRNHIDIYMGTNRRRALRWGRRRVVLYW